MRRSSSVSSEPGFCGQDRCLNPGDTSKQERSSTMPKMKDAEADSRKSAIGRRDFIKIGAAAGAGAVMITRGLDTPEASAQTSAQTSPQPWNLPPRGTNQPVSID